MDVLSIGTNACAEQLRERLNLEKSSLVEEGIKVEIEEEKQGDLTFFDCNINNINEFVSDEEVTRFSLKQVVKDYIAKVLSDIIINDVETVMIDQIVENECQEYSKKEQEIIYQSALEKLDLLNKEENDILSQINKKNRVQLELSNYLDINDEIILEGFVRFRLKDYFKELKVAVECAIDDLIIEKEYEEFITLLRYFVDIQEAEVDLIHVVRAQDSGFKLLDNNYEVVKNEYLEGFVLDMVDNELHYEDLLISALITVAPEKIKLHLDSEAGVIEAVRNIFTDKVIICDGCDYCEKVTTDKVFEYEYD